MRCHRHDDRGDTEAQHSGNEMQGLSTIKERIKNVKNDAEGFNKCKN